MIVAHDHRAQRRVTQQGGSQSIRWAGIRVRASWGHEPDGVAWYAGARRRRGTSGATAAWDAVNSPDTRTRAEGAPEGA